MTRIRSIPPDVMPVDEVAAALGIHPETVRRGIREGRLPGTHIGSRYVVNRAHFERWRAGEVAAHGGRVERPKRPGPISFYS